jgi:hypothetical protein
VRGFAGALFREIVQRVNTKWAAEMMAAVAFQERLFASEVLRR